MTNSREGQGKVRGSLKVIGENSERRRSIRMERLLCLDSGIHRRRMDLPHMQHKISLFVRQTVDSNATGEDVELKDKLRGCVG